MLSLSVALALLVGVVLFYLGKRGNIMWLKVWSIGLILLSFGYLAADAAGLF